MLLKKLFNITDPEYLSGLSKAGSIGLHLVSGIIVGTAIGYFLDEWLGTHPWLLMLFMILGIVAGFKNVYVDTKRLADSLKEEENRPGTKTDPGKKKPDDHDPASKNGNDPA